MNMDINIHIEDAKVYEDLRLTRCTYTLKITPKAGGETITMSDGKFLTLMKGNLMVLGRSYTIASTLTILQNRSKKPSWLRQIKRSVDPG